MVICGNSWLKNIKSRSLLCDIHVPCEPWFYLVFGVENRVAVLWDASCLGWALVLRSIGRCPALDEKRPTEGLFPVCWYKGTKFLGLVEHLRRDAVDLMRFDELWWDTVPGKVAYIVNISYLCIRFKTTTKTTKTTKDNCSYSTHL